VRRVDRGGLRLLQFSSLSKVEGLVCYLTTRPIDVRDIDDARRVFAAIDADPAKMVRVRQAHKAQVAVIGEFVLPERIEVDGLVTDWPNQPLFLRAADCSLVVVVDEAKRALGVAHAGWKGAARGIVVNLIKTMHKQYGSKPSALRAAIGPTISMANYPVGPEVPAAFLQRRAWAKDYVHARAGQLYFDLAGVNARFLKECGIPQERIEVSRMCTFDNHGLLHSYRHAGTDSGHHGVVAYWQDA